MARFAIAGQGAARLIILAVPPERCETHAV